MNEKIREIVKQSATDTSGKWVSLDNAEKLAELIVRECADLFDKDEIELTLTERTIHKTIKEHFGVDQWN